MIPDFDWVSKFVPFVLATGRQTHWNTQRVVEALLIAVITGAVTMYGVQKAQEVQMTNIREEIFRMRADMQQRIDEVRISVRENTAMASAREDRIENKIDAHIARTKP